MSARTTERKPWPMKWIVVAILAFIVPYTYLTLTFRKPGKAFEPYQDMKDRANVLRLLSAGYQRVPSDLERPADAPRPTLSAVTSAAAAGLPPELKATLIQTPMLPQEIATVRAPAIVNAGSAYPVDFTCTLGDNKREPSGAAAYIHGDEIVILPNFEHLADGLMSRSRDSRLRVTIPASVLKAGSYHVTLVGEHASRSWTLQVH